MADGKVGGEGVEKDCEFWKVLYTIIMKVFVARGGFLSKIVSNLFKNSSAKSWLAFGRKVVQHQETQNEAGSE